jgi:hypothetical protein
MSQTRSPSSTPTGRLTSIDLELGYPHRNPSPLNPNATPPNRTHPLPPFPDDNVMTYPSSPPLRGRAISAISEAGLPTILSVAREASSLSLPAYADEIRSTFRERSRSPGRSLLEATGQEEAEANLKASWWVEKHVARPWQASPKRKQTVPKEQTEAFQSTRTVSALSTADSAGL